MAQGDKSALIASELLLIADEKQVGGVLLGKETVFEGGDGGNV